MRVMRSIDRYTYPRPFKAWMYTIATNLARNHYDRAETRRVTGSDDEIANLISEDAGIEDGLAHQGDVQQIIATLGALPEHQREVIILRYYEECSLNEIADALNLPVGTVKSRLSIGLARLKSLMQKKETL
jgi:RNA polymerase sigma-70 factor (ECF subfamily)